MTFLHPKILYLLLLLPACLAWYIYRRREGYATLLSPSITPLEGLAPGPRVWLRHLPFSLRLGALTLVILALARPQSQNAWSEQDVEGIDIMLTMDISTSMEAMDFEPNRMEAARAVALEFVKHRTSDNIGLVAFAGESFTACPLTTDHASLINRLQEIVPGMIEDRTAIGLGLVTAINRLKDSPTNSKVIILLTDGVNNAGEISPPHSCRAGRSLWHCDLLCRDGLCYWSSPSTHALYLWASSPQSASRARRGHHAADR